MLSVDPALLLLTPAKLMHPFGNPQPNIYPRSLSSNNPDYDRRKEHDNRRSEGIWACDTSMGIFILHFDHPVFASSHILELAFSPAPVKKNWKDQ